MRPLIVANWKMNPQTLREAQQLFLTIQQGLEGVKNVDVVICPPFVYLQGLISATAFALASPRLRRASKGYGGLAFGSQDCFWEGEGAYTGEVSPQMLKNLGCSYVILGHSERRKLGETSAMVNKKIKAALMVGLIPAVCIGEDVEKEMKTIFQNIENWKLKIGNLILVYEPEGAISTEPGAKSVSPERLERALSAMRDMLLKKAGKEAAQNTSILYGGSVSSKNIREFMEKDIQGTLVGAVSLDAQEFIQLAKNAISR